MANIYTRDEIARVVRPRDAIAAMEKAFVAYSRGEAVIPPVGQMEFQEPPGDCHIKYGFLRGGKTFTVKIATGFWRNPERGLPSSNGVVLVFSAHTGELLAILQDEGFLTDIRTAAAGAVAAKYLAPTDVRAIGIIGAGTQAKLQLELLKEVTSCRQVLLWARSTERARAFRAEGFDITVASGISDLAAQSQLIVTTTPSRQWLLGSHHVRPGTHVTAVGADGGGKQELESRLFAVARSCIVDSTAQCSEYGDTSFALRERVIEPGKLVELGQVIENRKLGRQNEYDITIADLTGVAVQDILIADLALDLLEPDRRQRTADEGRASLGPKPFDRRA
jgi:ornithine cyclodeaminase